jgi:TolB-like protein/Flp pilus assembly protein TadD
LASYSRRVKRLISSIFKMKTSRISFDSAQELLIGQSSEIAEPLILASGNPSEEEARELISGLRTIDLPQFRVVGGIVRYDESAKNSLKDVKQRIVASLSTLPRGRDNYLIWGPPGSGKSFFVQEVAKSFGNFIHYKELNLAQLGEPAFRRELSEIEKIDKPRLCFIDEVDSKPSESWPYEALLPSLEPSDMNAVRTCFVLAGSSGSSIAEMKERIAKRPKGTDLLSRIPSGNECVIPKLGLGDKLLVASTQFLRAASESGRRIDEVEKLVLYYVAINPRLTSARQIRELAVRCIERIPQGEDRIKYDYLFNAGDPENKDFWIRAQPHKNHLANVFVSLRDNQVPKASPSEQKNAQLREMEQPHLDKHRIAVLPFVNISPDSADEYFADGMTEELIATISKISELRVIARTSVIRYKDGTKSAEEIGRELKAGSLLEGSVRKAGDKLRITAQLIESQTSQHLWSENYDRELKDVFAIQSDVAEKVAQALQVSLLSTERKRIEKEPTKSQEAHSYFLKGYHNLYELSEEGFKKANKYFELAAETDPTYVDAYMGIFANYFVQAIEGFVRFDQVYAKMVAVADKAIALDPNSAEAHLAISVIKFGNLDWSGAEEESRKSVEINPSLAVARQQHGFHLVSLGRREDALAEMRRFAELDPLSPIANSNLGALLYENGLIDESIAQLKKTISMDPYFHGTHMNLGYAYITASRFDEAIAELKEAIALSGGEDLHYDSYLAIAYAKSGRLEEAREILERLKKSSEERPISDAIAYVCLALGDFDEALAWAEKAFLEHNLVLLASLKVDHDWDLVRSDPRFVALLKKAGHLK